MALYQGHGHRHGQAVGRGPPPRAAPLLDLVPPSEEFSLSEYIDAAHAAIADIRGRGREVLFVGGTPLYLKSLLRGVYQGPPADWEFRRQIDDELKTLPVEALHQRLQVIDPLLAAKLHPNDKRRIIRGLEVFRLTGQRLSHLQTQFDEGQPAGAGQGVRPLLAARRAAPADRRPRRADVRRRPGRGSPRPACEIRHAQPHGDAGGGVSGGD